MPSAGGLADFRDRTPTRSAFPPGSLTSPCNSATRVNRPLTVLPPSPSRIPAGNRLLTATVDSDDLAATRTRWQSATRSAALIVLAVTLLLCCGPLVDLRNHARSIGPYVTALALMCGVIVIARVILRATSPADWSAAPVFSGVPYTSTLLRPFLISPFDFLLTAGTRARTGHPAALRDRIASHIRASASPRRIRRAPSVCHHAVRGRTGCRGCFPRSPRAAARHDHRHQPRPSPFLTS